MEHPEDYGRFEDRDDGISNGECLQMVGDLCRRGDYQLVFYAFKMPSTTKN